MAGYFQLKGCRQFMLFFVGMAIIMVSCVSERIDIETNHYGERATIHLCLDIPGLNAGTDNGLKSGYSPESGTISYSNENIIDYNKIHVLIFEKVGQDEVFRYKAEITALSPPQVTLMVPIGQTQNKYRFVVIANIEVPHIEGGTLKNEAMDRLIFDCAGKWNTTSENASLIPMWSEYGQLLDIKKDLSFNVFMYRALARVDIGLLFKYNNPNPSTGQEYPEKDTDKESVWGLKNFKIKDVRAYRTLNKAYAASSADKIVANEVVIPNVPVTAKYNSDSGRGIDDLAIADNNPLFYTLTEGSNSYIREIYIPEYLPIDVNSSSGNVPCLVIGGYYGEGNNTNVTYYRADFASYHNGKILSYRPILRNHRYVFDIRSVGGPGYENPEQALNSIMSDIVLDMIEWNEVPLNYEVHGSYFCSIDTREVILDARSLNVGAEISDTLFYKTNLDLDPVSNPFIFEWGSSGSEFNNDFEIIFDYSAKKIVIKAKSDNVGISAQPLSEQIYLTVENYRFTIDVKQKVINGDYTPDCSNTVVHGKYKTDFALNHTNFISVKLRSNTTLRGLEYDVRTDKENGIYFEAKGSFDTDGEFINDAYEYDLKLKGYGTLLNESSFYITIYFNSIIPVTCSVGIPVV